MVGNAVFLDDGAKELSFVGSPLPRELGPPEGKSLIISLGKELRI